MTGNATRGAGKGSGGRLRRDDGPPEGGLCGEVEGWTRALLSKCGEASCQAVRVFLEFDRQYSHTDGPLGAFKLLHSGGKST